MFKNFGNCPKRLPTQILKLFNKQEKEKLLERIDKMPEIVEMREGKEIKLGWIDKKKLRKK